VRTDLSYWYGYSTRKLPDDGTRSSEQRELLSCTCYSRYEKIEDGNNGFPTIYSHKRQ